ncbi:S41 family peptidase [Costertonia aggregata]|uniref:S41 family peptidase n=1 Tax=Costertonia aggregata TaxID=343403 RepID=A0A7H9AP07_9FLAO|nr:S41 family peptidase [Costertonia aggregata]QLG45170.1 S41 family peptidase [Costertonia aggregata]
MSKLFKLLSVFLVMSSVSCIGVKKHNTQVAAAHTPEELREDVAYTYKKFKQLHPNLYQYVSESELDRKFDSLKASLKEPMNGEEFYKVLSPVVSEIRQGHISTSFPKKRFTKKERKARKNLKLDFYELDFEYIDKDIYISRTGKKDSVLIGSRVLEVDKKPISTIIDAYRKTFSSDGYNTTFENNYIALRFGRLYAKHSGPLDSVSLKLQNKDSIYTKWFKRYDKTKTDTDVTAKSDSLKPEKIKLTRAEKQAKRLELKQTKKKNKKYGYVKSRDRFNRNFKFLDAAAEVGYFKIRSWTTGKYKEFYEESFTKLDSANAKYLVLDLRDNTGGRLAEIREFYKYLVDDEFQFVEAAYTKTRLPYLKNYYSGNPDIVSVLAQSLSVPILFTHNILKSSKKDGKLRFNYSYAKKTKPSPLNFKGKIYVLINGNSFSASSILSTNLKASNRAVFVGEETGGACNGTVAGFYKLITLPNTKVRVRFGLMQIQTPQKWQEPDGYGIKPDIVITPNAEDRFSGKDAEIAWVLEDIRAN